MRATIREQKPFVVSGRVSGAAGTMGTGFSAVKNSTGNYTVSLDVPAKTTYPLVTVSVESTAPAIAMTNPLDSRRFEVRTQTYQGTSTDFAFQFTASYPPILPL